MLHLFINSLGLNVKNFETLSICRYLYLLVKIVVLIFYKYIAMGFTQMTKNLLFWGLLFTGTLLTAQLDDKTIQDKAIESIPMYREFLAIPNDANYIEDILKNVDWCDKELKQRGFETRVLKTPTRPLLFAEWTKRNAAQKTVLFYFHIDGQSVDPKFWFQENPYKAVLKEEREGEGMVDISWDKLTKESFNPDWKMFARSASDSKNNIIQFLTAWDLFKNNNENLPYNLKLILDFEEEKSSPSLAQAVRDNKQLLQADMLVIYDGSRHISNEPTLSFGARGIVDVSLTVYGPVFSQHSGHFGNYAPNPALKLAQLLASMKDRKGRVLIPGYYDGISFDEPTEKILNEVPDDERVIKAKLGIAETDQVADSYQKALQYPSLNIRGMASGWVGPEARTIVPSQAVAEMDIRLVKESDPERLIKLLREHIASQGFHIISDKPTALERLTYPDICRFEYDIAYLAYRTEFDSGIGVWLSSALRNAFGKNPIRQRTSGGSVPIAPFIETLGVPAVNVGVANKDNNQHSPNENIRLGNYIDGVKTFYYILRNPVE